MKKINFCIFVFFLFIPEFVYSDDNLANFIIRDYSEGELPVVGNPDAKYTIVEFFDYRCGYCSKQAIDLAKLLEEKNNVKIIYLEFPIFGGISDTVARVALSIWNSDPDLYFDVHNKFMNLGPRMKKDNIIDTLNELKLDGELIFAEAEKDIDNKIILKNRSLAQSLNLRGTPALIINDNLSPGYLKYENLITFIE
jgi:protein-disulfide isomerase